MVLKNVLWCWVLVNSFAFDLLAATPAVEKTVRIADCIMDAGFVVNRDPKIPEEIEVFLGHDAELRLVIEMTTNYLGMKGFEKKTLTVLNTDNPANGFRRKSIWFSTHLNSPMVRSGLKKVPSSYELSADGVDMVRMSKDKIVIHSAFSDVHQFWLKDVLAGKEYHAPIQCKKWM